MTHDPGGKVRTKLPAGMVGWANLSPCGRYRRALGREWPEELGGKPGFVLMIGMNPSTADAEANDPTITREIGFVRSWGFSRLVKCNIGDYRATNPRDLEKPGVAACSPENVDEIHKWAAPAELVVLAHGVLPKCLRADGKRIAAGLANSGRDLMCFGVTKDGWPRHPLYLPKTAALSRYLWATEQ